MADEITLERDIDEILGQFPDAGTATPQVLHAAEVQAAAPEDEDEETTEDGVTEDADEDEH